MMYICMGVFYNMSGSPRVPAAYANISIIISAETMAFCEQQVKPFMVHHENISNSPKIDQMPN